MVGVTMCGYDLPDDNLVELVRRGQKAAFDALFGRYVAMIRGEAGRYGLQSSAGDVIQETFLRAYLNMGELDNPARFAPWLRAIAQRVCLTELRDRRRVQSAAAELERQTQHAEANRDELCELLALLPPDDREPLYLHYVLGLDTAAAAKAMGVSAGTFRVRLHRARKRARTLATSQRIEEMMIMTDQSANEVARKLLEEAIEAIRDEPPTQPKDWARFRSKLEQAVQADPDCRDAAWYLARKLLRDGDYREAIKLLQGLWDAGARDAWTTLTMAWSLDYLGRREEALQWYARTALTQFMSETQRCAASAGIEEQQRPRARPTVAKGLVEVPRDGWTATASHSETPPAYASDGNLGTRWTPMDHGQKPGLWLRIDLGNQIEGLAGVWLDDDAAAQSIYQNDAPRQCVVSISRDGEWWKRVGEWLWSPNHYMEAWWEPICARHLMLEQTGYCSPEWWSVYEVHVYRRG